MNRDFTEIGEDDVSLSPHQVAQLSIEVRIALDGLGRIGQHAWWCVEREFGEDPHTVAGWGFRLQHVDADPETGEVSQIIKEAKTWGIVRAEKDTPLKMVFEALLTQIYAFRERAFPGQ